MYSTFKQLEIPSSEALQLFCKVACARGGFHPFELQSRITETENTGFGKYFPRHIRIEAVLEKAYKAALTRHNNTNPGGPLPKRIVSKKSVGRYALQWKEGDMVITLTFLGNNTFLAVTGFNLNHVFEYATRLGLPKPAKQTVHTSQLTQNWHDVKIPLGDLIDFINRYRK